MMKSFSIVLVSLVLFLLACRNNQEQSKSTLALPNSQKALVKEVIHTTSYTYLKVLKNNDYQWIAINKQDVKEGSTIYFEGGLKMENFTSPELNRTFETVYFVQEISDQPIKREMPPRISGNEPVKPVLTKQEINIDKPKDAVTIGELYAKRDFYSGKQVKVKGQVTKVNLAIMNRNWIHLQDGTTDGENFDLTITTSDQPKTGDVVTYTGTLRLKQDFGMGYSYEILLENALPVE
jgi:hypothetical protein